MERQDLLAAVLRPGMAAEALHHGVEAPALQHIAEGDQQPVGVEWLHQEVQRAFAHGLDRAVQGAVRGDDDDRDLELAGADVLQDVEPVHVGQAQIEQHGIGRIARDVVQGLLAGQAVTGPERSALQVFQVDPRHRGRVLDEQHIGKFGIRHKRPPGFDAETLASLPRARQ
jgi:hypothetical protein